MAKMCLLSVAKIQCVQNFNIMMKFIEIFNIWQRYLARTVEKVPKELESVLDQETFTKARLYSLDKSTYGFWSGIYHQIESTVSLKLAVSG